MSTVNKGESIVLDVDALTVGDLEDFEEIVGKTMDEALNVKKGQSLPAKVLKAIVWIVKRQTNPDFTLEDARAVKVSELNLGGEPEGEPDPS